MRKNRILASAIAVSLAAIMACGTMAYFTATHSITNTLMTATASDGSSDGTPSFSIHIYEHELKDDGTLDTSKEVTENTYTGIMPGDTLPKDPTIRNTGTLDAYVRVHITFTKAAEWELILGEDTQLTSMLDLPENLQSCSDTAEVDESKDSITYDYYLKNTATEDILKAGDSQQLFSTVSIPGSLKEADLQKIDEFEIQISAEAIQTKNVGDRIEAAFELYDTL
jgi:hypothetical protein